jgi:hypothetical protein
MYEGVLDIYETLFGKLPVLSADADESAKIERRKLITAVQLALCIGGDRRQDWMRGRRKGQTEVHGHDSWCRQLSDFTFGLVDTRQVCWLNLELGEVRKIQHVREN